VSASYPPHSSLPISVSNTYYRQAEVVRVQRILLEDDAPEDCLDLQTWSMGHVVTEFMNLQTNERMIRIRFENGDEADVCEGAVHRPHRRVAHLKKLARSSRQRELVEHVSRAASPPLQFQGHTSSADDDSMCSTGSNGSDGTSSSVDSEATVSDIDVHVVEARAASAAGRYQRINANHRLRRRPLRNASATSSSHTESDLSQSEVDRPCRGALWRQLRRGEASQVQQEMAPAERGRVVVHAERVLGGPCRSGPLSATGGEAPVPMGMASTGAEVTGFQASQVGLGAEAGGSPPTSDSWYTPPPPRIRKKRAPWKKTTVKGRTEAASSKPGTHGGQTAGGAGTSKGIDPLLLRFSPQTWNKETHVYANPPLPFTGPEPGCKHPYGRVPSIMGLFDKFWSQKLQRRIIKETNRYASEVLDVKTQQTRGGLDWTLLGLEEFRAYISICLFMGLKKLPSLRMYWARNEPFLTCPIISHIMTRDRYEQITRCLHVANAPPSASTPRTPSYDKLHKMRWMLDEVRDRFKSMWCPNQQVTVDESMLTYKGKYCPIRQYMPKKPVRFGIKVWAASDALSKYLWNFEVYCGKGGNPMDDESIVGGESPGNSVSENEDGRPGKGEGLQGRNVVKTLMRELGGKGHIVTTDNFFTSVPLFLDLLETGIMATGTLRGNRKYVPRAMYAKKNTRKQNLGWIDYRMHRERKVCCMVWKDKQPVVLLSTHASPISEPGVRDFVRRKIRGKKKKVRTGPMLLQYTRNMRGVDTADQLRGVYSCLP
jgi:hypothetical protein